MLLITLYCIIDECLNTEFLFTSMFRYSCRYEEVNCCGYFIVKCKQV